MQYAGLVGAKADGLDWAVPSKTLTRNAGQVKPSQAGRLFSRGFMIMAAIAAFLQNSYDFIMNLRAFRRWIACCTVVVLTLGLVVHGFAAGNMGAKIISAATAGEMSHSSGCNGCGGGDDGMSTLKCYAVCGVTFAVLPTATPLKVVAIEPPTAVAARFDPSRGSAPDPYPPRAFLLS